jgi:putative transposase
MPRLPRLHVVGGFYHVTLRGNHRQSIFGTAADREKLNAIVAEAIEKYGSRVHAFCWMTNHLHLFIQVGESPLGKTVQRIAMRYARYQHKQLRTKGHLFERRYDARLVDIDSYFLAVLRYIHLNPCEAGMVGSPDDYRWSSHHAYVGREMLAWVTTEFGLGMLGKTIDQARLAYHSLLEGRTEKASTKWLPSIDSRVIGTDRFLASLPPPRIPQRSTLTLSELSIQVCARHSLSIEAVRSRSRARYLSAARAEIARFAIERKIASLHEVARFLGRGPSSLHSLMRRFDRR